MIYIYFKSELTQHTLHTQTGTLIQIQPSQSTHEDPPTVSSTTPPLHKRQPPRCHNPKTPYVQGNLPPPRRLTKSSTAVNRWADCPTADRHQSVQPRAIRRNHSSTNYAVGRGRLRAIVSAAASPLDVGTEVERSSRCQRCPACRWEKRTIRTVLAVSRLGGARPPIRGAVTEPQDPLMQPSHCVGYTAWSLD